MQNYASTSTVPIESDSDKCLTKEAEQKHIRNEFHFSLSSSLQNSLDLQDLLGHFYQMLKKAIHFSGMMYQVNEEEAEIIFGNRRAHDASYSLKIEGASLGHITFYSAKRFSEKGLKTIESLLGVLIPPLRNAHLYRDAVSKSLRDPLTQVGNRAAMEIALRRELMLAQRSEQPVSLLMLDIDFFKSINDTYGHQAGDNLLKHIAQTLQETLRETDQIFRFGGEEFIVLLNNTAHFDAMVIADRMRVSVEQTSIHTESTKIAATVSIGVSTGHDLLNQDQLIEQADKALYQAKGRGRNRIESSRVARTQNLNDKLKQRA